MNRVARALALALALVIPLRSRPAGAEVQLPRESPPSRVSLQVGLTEIAVEYSSPAVKNRRIWGDLVAYERPWTISPSPGPAPTIRFSRDVSVGDRAVSAGTYRLVAIPGKTAWSFVFDKSDDRGGASVDPGFGPGAVRVAAQARPTQHRERLTFVFSDFTDDRTSLDLEWEKLRVSVTIRTNTAQQVLTGIADLESTWRSYANAARFMLETKKDFDTGLKYANQSLALKEDWYTLWIKAALLAAKHDYRAAADNAQRAYDLGQQLGDGFILEPELKKALADWRKRRH